MKRIIITLCILFAAYTPAQAGEWFTWDETNTKLHIPLTVLMIVDMGQTLWIADNCNPIQKKKWIVYDSIWTPDQYAYWTEPAPCHEHYNLYLDEHPSKSEIYKYFIASYALTTFVVYALPERYSHALQGGVISLEAYMVENNYSLGIGVKF
jgi:hypothetical protein